MKNQTLFSPRLLHRCYLCLMLAALLLMLLPVHALAADDMWVVADKLIKDVYRNIAAISTVLAGLMSAIAVIGVKFGGNQQKSDHAWDWLKRIWVAWAIINGIGAFIAYIVPFFSGYATLTPGGTPSP